MTSRCHDTAFFCSKQTNYSFKMASFTISALASFFSGEQKSISRGENHYRSEHVVNFCYEQGVLRGQVQASMKNKLYKVTVSKDSIS